VELAKAARLAEATVVKAEREELRAASPKTHTALLEALAKKLKMSVEEVDAFLVGPLTSPRPRPTVEEIRRNLDRPDDEQEHPTRTGPIDPSSGEKPRIPFPWNPPDYLADASRKDRLETGLGIPLRTFVEGGNAVQYFDNVLTDKYLPTALIPRPEWGVSAFQVKGDSMAPRIMPGDIVFIGERLQNVRNGDIVVVALKTGGLTVKNLKILDAENWELVPTNPAHPSMKVNLENDVDWFVPVLGWFCPHYTRREVPWERDG
jgi:SOS-response transcriptional repressor LexA